MANRETLFKRLTRIMKGGVVVRSKIKTSNITDRPASSMLDHFNSQNYLYSNTVACVSGDTLIATTKGFIRIDELAKLDPGEKIEVISFNHDTNNVDIDIAYNARKTKTDKTLIITFDNGAILQCTYDHLILCRDGEFRQAQQLSIGSTIMPLYERDYYGYQCIKTYKRGWKATHRIVAEQNNKIINDDEVVHHKDFNKRNNCSENLETMTKSCHSELHAKFAAQHRNPGEHFIKWYENHSDKGCVCI